MQLDNDFHWETEAEIENLKALPKIFGRKISCEEKRPHHILLRIHLDNYFCATITFEYSRCLEFYLAFQQRRKADGEYGTIEPKRYLVPEQILSLGKYRNGRYYLPPVFGEISLISKSIITILIEQTPALLTMCRKSTPWYNEERMNETLREWHTEAYSFKIDKGMPRRGFVTGVKTDQQYRFDSCSGMHGSNGTYVENVNPEWFLKFRLRRLDFALDESRSVEINIHQYIKQKLKPRLDWGKITAGRLEQLNDALKSLTLKVVTREMEVAPGSRNFVPTEYASWDDALDSIFTTIK